MRRVAMCLTAAALILASPARAQVRGAPCVDPVIATYPFLHVGQPIRAELHETGEHVDGSIISCSGAVLAVDAARDSLALIDLRRPLRLEVGLERSHLVPMFVGGIAGMMAPGPFLAALGCCDDDATGILIAVPASLLGMLLGMAIGESYPLWDWELVTVESRP